VFDRDAYSAAFSSYEVVTQTSTLKLKVAKSIGYNSRVGSYACCYSKPAQALKSNAKWKRYLGLFQGAVLSTCFLCNMKE